MMFSVKTMNEFYARMVLYGVLVIVFFFYRPIGWLLIMLFIADIVLGVGDYVIDRYDKKRKKKGGR